jgi:type I restriction enzyme S subunit
VKDVFDNRLVYENARQITESDFLETHRRTNLEPGDILFTNTGTIGRMAIAPDVPRTRRTTFQKSVAILKPRQNLIEPRFLYYTLKFDNARLTELAAGTSQKNLLLKDFRSFEIRIPHPDQQRNIAHTLGTLDDKIELNGRMNETLEAIARALFKSWFVDFDPVRAMAEGSDPGLPQPLAGVFPGSFEDSELGEIPRGWEVGSFGNLISQRSERVGAREVVVLSAVATGKLARSDDHFTKRVYSKETDKYLVVEQWDFAYNPSRINIGSIGMLEEAIRGGVSPVYVVARPKPAYRWFLKFLLRRAYIKTWINTLASGSVRQSLSYADFASIPCVVPPEEVTQEFDQRWSTLRETIRSYEAESRTLATLRDTLLPKLISGKLRVDSAENFIERAAK